MWPTGSFRDQKTRRRETWLLHHDPDGQPCHVGMVVMKNLAIAGESRDLLTVLSKWGADGEYVQEFTKLPSLLGQPAPYGTDRRSV
jgi:hypothetical protein